MDKYEEAIERLENIRGCFAVMGSERSAINLAIDTIKEKQENGNPCEGCGATECPIPSSFQTEICSHCKK